jgi:glycopeptide antibiotics resistance protein
MEIDGVLTFSKKQTKSLFFLSNSIVYSLCSEVFVTFKLIGDNNFIAEKVVTKNQLGILVHCFLKKCVSHVLY